MILACIPLGGYMYDEASAKNEALRMSEEYRRSLITGRRWKCGPWKWVT